MTTERDNTPSPYRAMAEKVWKSFPSNASMSSACFENEVSLIEQALEQVAREKDAEIAAKDRQIARMNEPVVKEFLAREDVDAILRDEVQILYSKLGESEKQNASLLAQVSSLRSEVEKFKKAAPPARDGKNCAGCGDFCCRCELLIVATRLLSPTPPATKPFLSDEEKQP